MASTKEFKDFVLESLRLLDGIVAKPMMGEFLLYHKGVLFGGIYDNRLLLKQTKTNQNFALPLVCPYEGAKMMFVVEDLEDVENLKNIVLATCDGLK